MVEEESDVWERFEGVEEAGVEDATVDGVDGLEESEGLG